MDYPRHFRRRDTPLLQSTGIALDAQGRIYVADSENNRIVRIDDIAGGAWTTFGGSGGGPATFHVPWGIAVDARGRIYVADSENDRIVRIDDMSGAGWTVLAGTRPGSDQNR